ncbi:cell shape-determining protein MreB [Paractinoplanes rhizophilus]|uniref:Cell shape-determining protein MreB n=1 Tax=Paractinoplanes rhizophilus TaxID=1416877 RepID=A0ABW2I2T1_9ACTN
MRPSESPATRTALAVDFGSSVAGVWAARRGTVSGPSGDAFAPAGSLVRRGRVVDVDGCVAVLRQLVARYADPIPAGGVVAACRPVLTSQDDQAAMRRVVEAVFEPARVAFIDTVRAAAIGSGAAAGTLLVADLGAQLTEVALLQHGNVLAARRAEIGTRDLARGATADLIADIVARHVDELRDSAASVEMASASARGMLLVGDGAVHPELPVALAAALRMRVHRAAAPRTAALNGAGLAAMSLLRHPVGT